MNYKPLSIKKLQDFSNRFPDYSLGECIYSILATMKINSRDVKAELLTMSDEDIYIAIDRAIRLETVPENDLV